MILPQALKWPMRLCLAGLLALFGLAGSLIPVYHLVMLTLVRPWVERRGFAPGGFTRIAGLGFVAVIAEETLVGTIAAVNELNPMGLLIRPLQFIAFNLLAFAPLVLALATVFRRWRPGPWDALIIAGLWGLWAESIPQRLLAAPLMAGLLLLPTMGVYAVILTPALKAAQGQTLRPLWARALATWALAFALALPFIALLAGLRTAFPQAFPPCAWIAC